MAIEACRPSLSACNRVSLRSRHLLPSGAGATSGLCDLLVLGLLCARGSDAEVVDYPDPYPVRATKVVTLEDLGGTGDGDVTQLPAGEIRLLSATAGGPVSVEEVGQPIGDAPSPPVVTVSPVTALTMDREPRPRPGSALGADVHPSPFAAAGWYTDPAGTARHRYWNGEAWTSNVR